MLAVMALLGIAAEASAIDRYRVMTAAQPICRHDAQSTDVTVCGLRSADRFRVPFVVKEPGDPKVANVPQERERLLYRRTPVQELSPFLVGGGMAGVHFSTRDGVGAGEARRLAP